MTINTINRRISPLMKNLDAKNTLAALSAAALLLAMAFQPLSGIHRAPKLAAGNDIPQARPEYGLVLCENPGADKQAVRLAAIGDTKTADQRQASVGALLHRIHQRSRLDGIILLGDNASVRSEPAESLKRSFSEPYAPLIESGVPFYAVLGNHDVRNGMVECQTSHPCLNMNGMRYYSKVFGDNLVEAFFLDSNTIKKDTEQIAWLKQSLRKSVARWKVVAMHHPLHSTARYHHSDRSLTKLLEPIFTEQGVNLVLSGHNHVYERLYPINGIEYITSGSGGELRKGDLIPKSKQRAAGNDQVNVVLILQFSPEACHFTAYAPDETVVDEGEIAAAEHTVHLDPIAY